MMPTTNAIRLMAWASRRPGMGPNQPRNFCDASRIVLIVTRQARRNRVCRSHVAAQFHIAILFQQPNLPARVIVNQPLIFFWSKRACPDDFGAIDVGSVIDKFFVHFMVDSIPYEHQMVTGRVLESRCHSGVFRSHMIIDRTEQITVLGREKSQSGAERKYGHDRPGQIDSFGKYTGPSLSRNTNRRRSENIKKGSSGRSVMWIQAAVQSGAHGKSRCNQQDGSRGWVTPQRASESDDRENQGPAEKESAEFKQVGHMGSHNITTLASLLAAVGNQPEFP